VDVTAPRVGADHTTTTHHARAMGMYDEFGNYVGPELDDDSDGGSGEDRDEDDTWMDQAERDADARGAEGDRAMGDDENSDDNDYEKSAIVLAEDKKYYPSAEEVYGAGTETLVMDEDAQPLEEPIIAPLRHKKVEVRDANVPQMSNVSETYLLDMLRNPNLTRNVAVCGHLHHGKTSLMDMLVQQTHAIGGLAGKNTNETQTRYCDNRLDEQARCVSIKATPVSLALPASNGKHLPFNLMDTPGHVNFGDEVTCSLRLADSVLLVVDACEGVMCVTERVIALAARERLPIVVFVNKIDRLILELKLPPADAFYKIKHVLEEVNVLIGSHYGDDQNTPWADPVKGTVCFGSATYGWSFTLTQFAAIYAKARGAEMDTKKFAARLWGDSYFHPETRTFSKKPSKGGGARSFVQFILEPLYKVYSQAVGEHPASVAAALGEFGVSLKPSEYRMNVKPLLRLALSKIFGDATGLVDMLKAHCPNSAEAARAKVQHTYGGPLSLGGDSVSVAGMTNCDPNAQLRVAVAKLYPKDDCTAFDALARVMSGTLKLGQTVKVLGEGFSPDDEEDVAVKTVTNLWVYNTRYRIPVQSATPGMWVLVEGVDESISKTATLVDEFSGGEETLWGFKPLRFDTTSVIKIATEPLNPADLPKMVEALRCVNKSYPACVTKVEESGEHTICGTGELFLDAVMKDLRELYSSVEVKVADPVVTFTETVVETSSLKCFAETPNGKNKLTMIAEPLDKGLARDMESGSVSLSWPKKKLGDFFQNKYDWDILAARSVWAFGPDLHGANLLLDDTLPGEVDKALLNAVKSSIVQGFQWGTREGPLCDEPIRDVKFKILDALVSETPALRGGGQMIPTARRCAYSAFLTASPRLMEPIYAVEIQTPADCMSAVYNVLSKRRGHVVADAPRPGTPVYVVKALLPAIESFGFETDLRYHTQGQAFGMSYFDHWAVVPGDPLDRSIVLRPLEPSPAQHLAREFMVKTRRRKGMSEDVSVNKFFDQHLLMELARAETEFGLAL